MHPTPLETNYVPVDVATQVSCQATAFRPNLRSGSLKLMFADVAGPSFIFWPVGCGDSTTVVISETEVLQIDLNDTVVAAEDDNERVPLVDELVAKLPTMNGRPYLSCFVLTHPDLDHCRGFSELLKRVTIGELWHTPRVFREYHRDMSDDAVAFRREAARRVARTIAAAGDPGPGDRVRVIGYDDLLKEQKYNGFPRSAFTTPGQVISIIDGKEARNRFSAFVHAPFKNDSAEERNETSLAMQILIGTSVRNMAGLFLGDLSYPTLRRVIDESRAHGNSGRLAWDVLLAPHHCSKKAMYERDASGADVLRQDILNDFEKAQRLGGFIVASARCIPGNNSPGDNPPHAKAKNRYEEIVSGRFICTGDHSTVADIRPVMFTVTDAGIDLINRAYVLAEESKVDLMKAIAAARGSNAPPTVKVGFGRA